MSVLFPLCFHSPGFFRSKIKRSNPRQVQVLVNFIWHVELWFGALLAARQTHKRVSSRKQFQRKYDFLRKSKISVLTISFWFQKGQFWLVGYSKKRLPLKPVSSWLCLKLYGNCVSDESCIRVALRTSRCEPELNAHFNWQLIPTLVHINWGQPRGAFILLQIWEISRDGWPCKFDLRPVTTPGLFNA